MSTIQHTDTHQHSNIRQRPSNKSNVSFLRLTQMAAPEDDEEAVPEDVVHRVLEGLQREVDDVLLNPPLQAHGWFRCIFCPFRAFKRADRLKKHVRKYHCRPRLFTANSRTQAQWNLVVVALYEQKQALQPLDEQDDRASLLRMSASLLREWMSFDDDTSEFLRGSNDVDCVLLLTGTGPKYVLKTQTANAKRLHKKLYYDHTFVNILLPCMLQHHGKSAPTFLDVTQRFVAAGSQCALLGTRNRLTRRRLLDDIRCLPQMQAVKQNLLDACTAAGEWKVLAHDATFKSLFSILGQEKMQQKEGEFHALHSILGRSGALPGLCLQRTEGAACFRDAILQVLPETARATTQWVFSDTPESIGKAGDIFPVLQGVAEDPLHLTLRVEEFFGERRTELSRCILQIQAKFNLPHTNSDIYSGGPARPGEEGQQLLRKLTCSACQMFISATLSRVYKWYSLKQIIAAKKSHIRHTIILYPQLPCLSHQLLKTLSSL